MSEQQWYVSGEVLKTALKHSEKSRKSGHALYECPSMADNAHFEAVLLQRGIELVNTAEAFEADTAGKCYRDQAGCYYMVKYTLDTKMGAQPSASRMMSKSALPDELITQL